MIWKILRNGSKAYTSPFGPTSSLQSDRVAAHVTTNFYDTVAHVQQIPQYVLLAWVVHTRVFHEAAYHEVVRG